VPSSLSRLVQSRPVLSEPWNLQKLALDGIAPHGTLPVPRCGSELGEVSNLPGVIWVIHVKDPSGGDVAFCMTSTASVPRTP
jgi:hypothetical protein